MLKQFYIIISFGLEYFRLWEKVKIVFDVYEPGACHTDLIYSVCFVHLHS